MILFFSDNERIFRGLEAYLTRKDWDYEFACSPGSTLAQQIRIADHVDEIRAKYDLVVSAHCKQIFPESLVTAIPCVNLHPGYNPETRGWYPQSFALAYGRKIGFTVHLMTPDIDDGPIILREEIEILPDDISSSLYDRVVTAEIASFDRWLPSVVRGDFATIEPEGKGHYSSPADFRDLCRLDLDRVDKFRTFLDQLRATSFAPHQNAYFVDPETGRKIYVRVELTDEKDT